MGVPPAIIHFRLGFSLIKQPFWGIFMTMGPPYVLHTSVLIGFKPYRDRGFWDYGSTDDQGTETGPAVDSLGEFLGESAKFVWWNCIRSCGGFFHVLFIFYLMGRARNTSWIFQNMGVS